MTMMNHELKAARTFLTELWGDEKVPSVLCAVSGGLDSMCLLHFLSEWGREQGVRVTAAHFNHQIRGEESDRDESFVRNWCADHGIPFVCGRGDVPAAAAEKGLSLEEAAREMRYAFLEEQKRLLECAFILTAHHADDNAETILLNLLRGTGLRGLTGIPVVRDCIARPFLRIQREELAAYAAKHNIPHVEDGTNALDDAARNVLRHKVLPVLRELNPRAAEHMARTAELLAEDEAALDEEAETFLNQVRLEENHAECRISELLRVKQAIRSRCIRKMLAHVGGHEKDLTAAHVDAVCELLCRQSGKEVSLPYHMWVRADGDLLTVRKQQDSPEEIPIQVGTAVSFGVWRVELSAECGEQGIALPADAEIRVSVWRKDDRMTLPGSRGARSFKRICSDRGISSAQRDLLPVLRVNGKAAAAPNVGLDLEFTPQADAAVFLTFKNTEERIR